MAGRNGRSKKDSSIVLVEFRGVPHARAPYALVVIEGDQFSKREVRELLASECHNPSRFQWMDSIDQTTVKARVEVIRRRYAGRKRRQPTPNVDELRYLLR